MNKENLIKAISHGIGKDIPQSKISMILNKTVEVISQTLDKGEPVKWAGFGSMVPKETAPRRLYSPTKKEYIVSKGTKKVVFYPSRMKRNKSD